MTHVLPQPALGAPDRCADCSGRPVLQQKAINTATTVEQTRFSIYRHMCKTGSSIAAQEDSYFAPQPKAQDACGDDDNDCKQERHVHSTKHSQCLGRPHTCNKPCAKAMSSLFMIALDGQQGLPIYTRFCHSSKSAIQ